MGLAPSSSFVQIFFELDGAGSVFFAEAIDEMLMSRETRFEVDAGDRPAAKAQELHGLFQPEIREVGNKIQLEEFLEPLAKRFLSQGKVS